MLTHGSPVTEPARHVPTESEDGHPTLLLFHVGKTGGTALTRYFRNITARCYVQPKPDDLSLIENPSQARGLDFISAHYRVGPWLHRVPRCWRTMVVLRSPVQHLLSSYWHIRTHGPVSGASRLVDLLESAARMDIDAFLDAGAGERFVEHFDNPQARFILGKPVGLLTTADAERAAALLASVTYVGTTEHLDSFAAQVASMMPWATGWEGQTLPLVLVNPLNRCSTDEIPRPLLRRILAVTEIDAELHQQAGRLHAERLGAVRPKSDYSYPRSTSSAARAIPLADLVRVSPIETQHVQPGRELRITDDELLLHPPAASQGSAMIAVDGVSLSGHSELGGRLLLAHERAMPVRFTLDIAQADAAVLSASFTVTSGQPLSVRIRFRPVTGRVRLCLRTEMANVEANAFAWATFAGFAIT